MSVTPELQAAAERLRRYAAGESFHVIYPSSGGADDLRHDRDVLRSAYLAELDDRPVTEEWLSSVARSITDDGHLKRFNIGDGSEVAYIGVRVGREDRLTTLKIIIDVNNDMTLAHPTISQVITACRLFGVQLKEGK